MLPPASLRTRTVWKLPMPACAGLAMTSVLSVLKQLQLPPPLNLLSVSKLRVVVWVQSLGATTVLVPLLELLTLLALLVSVQIFGRFPRSLARSRRNLVPCLL